MSREEIQKLLGGYATNTLSEAERTALFEAALEDQQLFDALAKEQALRDVLQDPSARQQLVAALGPAREPFAVALWRWLHRPTALAMVAGSAALLIVAALVLRQARRPVRREVIVADVISQPSAPLLKKMAPPVVEPKRKRSVPLPAGRAAPAPPPVAQAAPTAAPPQAVGAFAPAAPAPAEARDQALQSTQSANQSFVARPTPPMPSMRAAKAAVAGALVKPPVAYTLLLKDADGTYAPMPSDSVFHTGDSVRLQIQPRDAGFIYLFQRDPTGAWILVASQRVEKDQRYELPPTGALHSDVPARLELSLVFSRVERSDLDALVPPSQPASRITLEFR